jgi:histone H3/H4
MLVAKSQVKAFTSLKVSQEVYEALDEKVKEILKAAEKRAIANGRKTIRACDL